jgi:hypothetical protein
MKTLTPTTTSSQSTHPSTRRNTNVSSTSTRESPISTDQGTSLSVAKSKTQEMNTSQTGPALRSRFNLRSRGDANKETDKLASGEQDTE